jgi:MSHA biogenesis protein MshQ
MNRIIKLLYFIVLILSAQVIADDDSNSCRVSSKSDFSVSFKIDDADLKETVWALQSNGKGKGNKRSLPLWTNDGSYKPKAVITDKIMTKDRDYKVWLWYEHSGNQSEKKGFLHYYLKQSGQWRLIERNEADLSSLNSASITVRAVGDEVEGFSCGARPPEPEEPEYNENAQFEFGSTTCASSSCNFPLIKDYQYTPVVILMPTIGKHDEGENGTNPDSDAPASAFLNSVDINAKQVSFEIKRPTSTGGGANQMVKVDYLVVEPGTAHLNGHTVVAGYIDTNKQVYINGPSESTNDAWSAGKFSNFGLKNAFSSPPVVLTQVQSANNDKWVTAAIRNQGKTTQVSSKQGVEVSLELSRSRDHSYQYKTERIGYIATLAGDGKVDGYKFNFGKLTTPHVTSNQPLEQGCSTLHDLGLNGVSSVVAKKMERNGSDGGWLRRCRLDGNKASFVVDEDDWERSHLPEEVGYFSTEKETVNICKYLTGPAQTWSDTGNAKLDWTSVIVNAHNGINIGFPSINTPNEHKSSCVNGKCVATQSLMVEQPPFINFTPSGGNLVYDQDDVGELSSGSYSSVNIGGNSRVEFTGGEYWIGELSIGNSAIVEVTSDTILNVNKLVISGNARLNHQGTPAGLFIVAHNSNAEVRLEGSSKFKAFVLSENLVHLRGSTEITGAVTAKVLDMQGSPKIIGDISSCKPPPEQDYRIIVVPEQDLSLTCDRQPVEFQVQDENGVPAGNYDGQVSVTSSLSTANKAFWYLSEQGGEDRKLDVSQSHAFNADGNGKVTLWLKSDVVGTIEATGSLSTDSSQVAIGQYGFVPFKFEITNSYLPIVAGKPVGISIKAKACKTDNSDEVSIGYDGKRKLKFNTAYNVPNTGNQKIELRASSATNDWLNDEIELDFNQGIATAELRYLDAGKTALTIYDPQCSLAEGCEILPESKILSQYDIGDWTRLEGKQSIWSRPYTFALCNATTPYIESATGTSKSGRAFIASGETFGLKAKPIIWLDSDAANDDIGNGSNATQAVDSSAMCYRQETTNFYKNDAPTASVVLTIPSGDGVKPHSPTKIGSVSGNLTSLPLDNTQIKGSALSASWDEVGSILLQGDTQARYLGMDINMGYRPVGRFYPAYFTLISTESGIQYPDAQSFVYMDQAFATRVKVEAQNAADKATVNYGDFSPSYQVGLEVEAIDSTIEFGSFNRLTNRIDWSGLPKEWGKNWQGAHITLGWSPLMFLRDITGSAIPPQLVTTTEDGPYDVAVGILREELSVDNAERIGYPAIDNNMDVVYCDSGADCREPRVAMKFADFNTRYGRMVMDDAGGRADSNIAIPLRVEFWNGFEFEAHQQDSVSLFDGEHYCAQIIAQSENLVSTSKTVGRGSVKSGEITSGQFVAVPHQINGRSIEGYREQVRFWQKLVNSTPKKINSNDNEIKCQSGNVGSSPQRWLLYNWRGLGDENPSAIVTFGVYRGNDRIIYRGEKGMNQLLK